MIYIHKKDNTFIQHKLNCSKSDSKDINNCTEIFYFNKCCSFELSIYQIILKNKMYHSFHKNIGQLFSTLIIIRNVS